MRSAARAVGERERLARTASRAAPPRSLIEGSTTVGCRDGIGTARSQQRPGSARSYRIRLQWSHCRIDSLRKRRCLKTCGRRPDVADRAGRPGRAPSATSPRRCAFSRTASKVPSTCLVEIADKRGAFPRRSARASPPSRCARGCRLLCARAASIALVSDREAALFRRLELGRPGIIGVHHPLRASCLRVSLDFGLGEGDLVLGWAWNSWFGLETAMAPARRTLREAALFAPPRPFLGGRRAAPPCWSPPSPFGPRRRAWAAGFEARLGAPARVRGPRRRVFLRAAIPPAAAIELPAGGDEVFPGRRSWVSFEPKKRPRQKARPEFYIGLFDPRSRRACAPVALECEGLP